MAAGALGAAAVLAFAKAGYNVAFTYNAHPDAADAVRRQAEALAPAGASLAIRADAGDSVQVQAAVEQAQRELGSLQVLVCNAGIAQVKLFTDTTDEDWRRMMAVDMDGAFLRLPCRAARHDPPEVRPHPAGQRYVGQTGGSCEVAYSAAKAGPHRSGQRRWQKGGPQRHHSQCHCAGRH